MTMSIVRSARARLTLAAALAVLAPGPLLMSQTEPSPENSPDLAPSNSDIIKLDDFVVTAVS